MSEQEQPLNELMNKLFMVPTKSGPEKLFVAPKSEELATGKDFLNLAFGLGKLAHSIEQFERVVRDAAPLLTVGDLRRIIGQRKHEAISSVEELERLFRLR